MPLSDLAVFNEFSYASATEVLDQQVDLFNTASMNTIQLASGANLGDYNESAHWGKISDLVRRRNAYGTGTVAEKDIRHLKKVAVKVACGTPPVRIDPGMLKWIQTNPREAGAMHGQQLAKGMLADQLNTGILGAYSALSAVSENTFDGSTAKFDAKYFLKGARKFGDRSEDLAIWIMHSSPLYDLYESNMSNTEKLFTYGTVRLIADAFGRLIVVTDSPSLVTEDGVESGVDAYHTLGLVPGAIKIEINPDFTQNIETKNGSENIISTIQSEWTYNLGLEGFAWDKASGGASPTQAALGTSGNWDRYATSNKDLLGVLIESR